MIRPEIRTIDWFNREGDSRRELFVPVNKSKSKSKKSRQQDDGLEKLLQQYIAEFAEQNTAAKVVTEGLRVMGIGLRPLVDRLTFRTLDVEQRAKEFIRFGYRFDRRLGRICYEHGWAKVYRKAGYPALFITQAYDGKRGNASVIRPWVSAFGDKTLHHMAILVGEIEEAVFYLEKQGVPFSGKVVGRHGKDLRQTFAAPEIRNGMVYSVLELTERHHGNHDFLKRHEDFLMKSTH